MKIRPLFDKVLVELQKETVSPGGIIIPGAEDHLENQMKGTVVAVGKGRRDGKGGRTTIGVKPGDKVLFESWAVAEFIVEGEKMYMGLEESIIGVYENANA